MAADGLFQPDSAEELLMKAHSHLEVSCVGYINTYRFPSNLNTSVAKSETLWKVFQVLRLKNRPEGSRANDGGGSEEDGNDQSDGFLASGDDLNGESGALGSSASAYGSQP